MQLSQDSKPEEEDHKEDKQEALVPEQQDEGIVNGYGNNNNNDGASNNEDASTKHKNKPKKSSQRTKPFGLGYTQEETETLCSCTQKVILVGPQDWENILQKDNNKFSDTDCGSTSYSQPVSLWMTPTAPTSSSSKVHPLLILKKTWLCKKNWKMKSLVSHLLMSKMWIQYKCHCFSNSCTWSNSNFNYSSRHREFEVPCSFLLP